MVSATAWRWCTAQPAAVGSLFRANCFASQRTDALAAGRVVDRPRGTMRNRGGRLSCWELPPRNESEGASVSPNQSPCVSRRVRHGTMRAGAAGRSRALPGRQMFVVGCQAIAADAVRCWPTSCEPCPVPCVGLPPQVIRYGGAVVPALRGVTSVRGLFSSLQSRLSRPVCQASTVVVRWRTSRGSRAQALSGTMRRGAP